MWIYLLSISQEKLEYKVVVGMASEKNDDFCDFRQPYLICIFDPFGGKIDSGKR